MQKTFVRGTWQQKRAFSPAVIVTGAAKTIYVAGHTGQTAEDGTAITDFEAQCRRTFRNIEVTLAEAGAKLSDLVTMTVFLTDVRYTTPMTEIREEIFRQEFSGQCRAHRHRFREAGYPDRDPGHRGRSMTMDCNKLHRCES